MRVPRFWREIPARYNLIGSKCETCGTYYFPPRHFCPECRRQGKMVEYQFKGTGEVVTYSTIYTPGDSLDRRKAVRPGDRQAGRRPSRHDNGDLRAVRYKDRHARAGVFRKIGEDGDKGMIHYGTKFVPGKGLTPFTFFIFILYVSCRR